VIFTSSRRRGDEVHIVDLEKRIERRSSIGRLQPFLAQHNRTAFIMGYDVGRVLADIDANHGDCSVSVWDVASGRRHPMYFIAGPEQ
jgi:hypothetical protein